MKRTRNMANIIRTNWGKVSAIVALIGLLIIGAGFISSTSSRATQIEADIKVIQIELPKKMDKDVCDTEFKNLNQSMQRIEKMVNDMHKVIYPPRDFKSGDKTNKLELKANNEQPI